MIEVSWSPRAFLFKGFLSHSETQHLIDKVRSARMHARHPPVLSRPPQPCSRHEQQCMDACKSAAACLHSSRLLEGGSSEDHDAMAGLRRHLDGKAAALSGSVHG